MQDLELAENISVTVPSQVRVCEGEGEHNNRLRYQDLLVHRSGYEESKVRQSVLIHGCAHIVV